MSPDEQQQFIARMKDRGVDTSAFEQEMKADAAAARPPAASQGAQTIDALVAPLPVTETSAVPGCMDHQLKPVNLRLGISDGTNSEMLSGERSRRVVTGVTVSVADCRRPAAPAIR
jgi:hypothetical protein